jgi:uncharacterized protein (TIGR03435 family)
MTRFFAPFVLVVSLGAASDVISVIKPSRSVGGGQLGVPFDGQFTATNVTVRDVIAAAYGGLLPLDADHILGLPTWALSQRFDFEARMPSTEPTRDAADDSAISAAFSMVRAMLEERFALRVHDASRIEPTFALVRTNRNGAAKLPPTARDCEADEKLGPFVERPSGPDRVPLPPCGMRVRAGEIVASGATTLQLASRLSRLSGIGRAVSDETRLQGRFDFTLRWTPPQTMANTASDSSAAVESGPSLFTALREQLGLRLQSQRAPVHVLIVDHIERPNPN